MFDVFDDFAKHKKVKTQNYLFWFDEVARFSFFPQKRCKLLFKTKSEFKIQIN